VRRGADARRADDVTVFDDVSNNLLLPPADLAPEAALLCLQLSLLRLVTQTQQWQSYTMGRE
jgi:hypothetical protein